MSEELTGREIQMRNELLKKLNISDYDKGYKQAQEDNLKDIVKEFREEGKASVEDFKDYYMHFSIYDIKRFFKAKIKGVKQ